MRTQIQHANTCANTPRSPSSNQQKGLSLRSPPPFFDTMILRKRRFFARSSIDIVGGHNPTDIHALIFSAIFDPDINKIPYFVKLLIFIKLNCAVELRVQFYFPFCECL